MPRWVHHTPNGGRSLGTTHLTSPRLASPRLASPRLASPHFTWSSSNALSSELQPCGFSGLTDTQVNHAKLSVNASPLTADPIPTQVNHAKLSGNGSYQHAGWEDAGASFHATAAAAVFRESLREGLKAGREVLRLQKEEEQLGKGDHGRYMSSPQITPKEGRPLSRRSSESSSPQLHQSSHIRVAWPDFPGSNASGGHSSTAPTAGNAPISAGGKPTRGASPLRRVNSSPLRAGSPLKTPSRRSPARRASSPSKSKKSESPMRSRRRKEGSSPLKHITLNA